MAEGKVIAVMGGFETYVPASLPNKYEVLGDDMQVLNVKLDVGETLISESGSMNFMSRGVKSNVDCSQPCGRCCSGEACIMSTFTGTQDNDFVAVTPKLPAKIIPIPMGGTAGKFRAKDGAYFASLGDAKVSFAIDCNPCTVCCGGQGCIQQTMEGEGTVFVSAMGTILQKNLDVGEVLVIDTDSLVAWEDSAKLGIKRAGGCCTCCFGGEGLFNTTITGPGQVFVQSMSIQKFKNALKVEAETKRAERKNKTGQIGGAPLAPDADDMGREADVEDSEIV